jgi:hypothetical protein
MVEKIILDMLTQDSVSVKKQKYIEDGGIQYDVGQPSRCAYINTIRGRQEMQAGVPEPYLGAILAVWGDTPTVTEPSY